MSNNTREKLRRTVRQYIKVAGKVDSPELNQRKKRFSTGYAIGKALDQVDPDKPENIYGFLGNSLVTNVAGDLPSLAGFTPQDTRTFSDASKEIWDALDTIFEKLQICQDVLANYDGN